MEVKDRPDPSLPSEKEMRSEKSERRQNGRFGEDTYFIPGKH